MGFFTAAACVVINRMLVHMTLNSFSSKMGALNSCRSLGLKPLTSGLETLVFSQVDTSSFRILRCDIISEPDGVLSHKLSVKAY